MVTSFRTLFSTSETEYQAALNGVNIFFGAILGVTLAGTDGLATLPYITLLVIIFRRGRRYSLHTSQRPSSLVCFRPAHHLDRGTSDERPK